MSFNGKKTKAMKEPALVLKRNGRHYHGEPTVDGHHRYCACCDVFTTIGMNCGRCEFGEQEQVG